MINFPIHFEENNGFSRKNEPVTFGVPFPKGSIFEVSELSLLDQRKKLIPHQVAVLSRWSDESIKWALLDFQVDMAAYAKAEYWLQSTGTSVVRNQQQYIIVEKRSDMIVVDTGYGTYSVNTRRLKPFESVIVQGRDIVGNSGNRIVLTDDMGREYEPVICETSIEAEGPLRVTLRLQGKLLSTKQSPAFADFIARLSFYAQTSLVELKITLRNPNAAQHPGGFWDLGDAGSVYFRDFSLYTTLSSDDALAVAWTTQPAQPLENSTGSKIEIYQDSSGGENWQSTSHVNRFGKVMHAFQGYRVTVDHNVVQEGKRATPVVRVCDGEKGIAATIENFWQNFPKALEVESNTISVRLFPRQYSDVYELQGGEQKTHTIFLQFDNNQGCIERINWVHDRLRPRISPEWYANSQAFGYLLPQSSDTDFECQQLVDIAINGKNTFIDRREIIDEYGWRNFGELYADHEAVGQKSTTQIVSHYNNQYDVIYGALIQYVRSNDLRWFHLMNDLAKHVIDIDIYHTQRDRPAFNGGLFWHTEHYTDAATSTHRAYSLANAGTKSRHLCGGGPSSEHNYTSGLLHYYFLTGDTAASEVVQGLAEWVISMDNESTGVLGILDRRPTGFCSATVDRDYHGPGRGAGNSTNALIDAYLLTQDEKYLAKAEQLIRRCIHPKDNIQNRKLEDIENRWSYTVFLQVLGKYLDFKVEKDEIDYMYSYARESLIHYAKWMLENEIPYKSMLDRVKIPTETWPAQDIKKSNVFNIAAKYSTGSLKNSFIKNADLFFETCIRDLMSFETHYLTRPVVILMVNGFIHSYFKTFKEECVPLEINDYDFGCPQIFKQKFYEIYKIRQKLLPMIDTLRSTQIRSIRDMLQGSTAGAD
jgi:hypothetical protein